MEIVIVTGLSGAGKTAALNVLEDEGYLSIDNLPTPLIRDLVELMEETPEINKIALALDQRGRVFKRELYKTIKDLKDDYGAKVLFLNATDNELIKRFKEKRRLHPMSPGGTIVEGIRKERELMDRVMDLSIPIDTTNLTLGELKNIIHSLVLNDKNEISVIFKTFGFKNGIVADADLVFDVRFITNPYYVSELKLKSGYNPDCYNFVLAQNECGEFIEKVHDLLKFLIPLYENEGKEQLIVAFGCTGGRQRSVSVARRLAELLKESGINITIINRDLDEAHND
ncbi:MAG: RNase adapter RapZ [Ezakiella coagulans]|uniref:RNase adapter RapZ n=1 Tax=Ezakiella coagulans TaxID=46507 RepID=UPI00399A3AF5